MLRKNELVSAVTQILFAFFTEDIRSYNAVSEQIVHKILALQRKGKSK